jgi:hypothetical protein
MGFLTSAILSLSIVVAALIGWMRIRKIDPAFFPFLILIWLGLANEIIAIVLVRNGFSNSIANNIFSMLESFLVTWQLKNWRLFDKKPTLYWLMQLTLLLSWCIDQYLTGNIREFNSKYLIVQSLAIVFLTITILARNYFESSLPLHHNALIMISSAWIIYFTYTSLAEFIWMFGLERSISFRIKIIEIMTVVNAGTNFLFAYSILWIPRKRKSILYSCSWESS